MTAPKHTLAADELVRGALTAVIVPVESLNSRPGKPIITRVKIQKEGDMESAVSYTHLTLPTTPYV